MPYIGKTTDGFGVRNRFVYLASSGDTSVSGADANGATLTFTDGAYVDVYLNGVLLKPTTDYNTSTTNTIAGLSALNTNDEVTVVVYDIFTVADMVSATSGGTFSVNVTFNSDITVGDDIILNSDSAAIKFGADSEITLTHSADSGLLLKHANTADDSAPVLTFQTGDNDIAQNDVLGSIKFQAPDEGTGTDAILVGASIDAVAETNFAADNNSTSIVFATAESATASEVARFTGAGRLGVGVTDPDQILELNDQTSGADVAIHFAGNGVDHTIGTDASNGGFLTISNNATVGTSPYFTFGASTRIFAGAASNHSAIAGGGISIKPTSNTHQLMLEQENGSNGAEGWLFHASSGGGPLIFTRRTSSADTARFQIASGGDLTATDTDGIGSISDERLKKDIVDFTYSIDDFKKYKPRQFNWKNPELHLNQTNTIGFIAQELEAVDNRFVYETTYYDVKDTDEYKALEKKVTDKTATEDEETTYNEMKLQSENNKDNLDKQYLDADGVAKASKLLRKDAMYVSVIQQLIARIEALESK